MPRSKGIEALAWRLKFNPGMECARVMALVMRMLAALSPVTTAAVSGID